MKYFVKSGENSQEALQEITMCNNCETPWHLQKCFGSGTRLERSNLAISFIILFNQF